MKGSETRLLMYMDGSQKRFVVPVYQRNYDWKTENYMFDYGNVRFCVMGVNGPEDVNDWVVRELKKCDKTWKIEKKTSLFDSFVV